MKSKKQNKQIPASKKEIKTGSFFESTHKEVERFKVPEWLALTARRNMLKTLTLTNLTGQSIQDSKYVFYATRSAL